MRGADHQQSSMFSYISAERRVPKEHPLRAIRAMADGALDELGPRFDALYAGNGRPSIAPEKLLRALLLQALYTVRSERLLIGPQGQATVLLVKRSGALPTGSTGTGILGSIPPVDLWATRWRWLTRGPDMAQSMKSDV